MVPTEINLEKYVKLPESEIYVDPRPRIRNIVRELEEEHGWTWPPQPPKDFEKSRLMKRRKWSCLYSKECLDICSILALIIGPWELLVAFGFTLLPKTFVPAMRESSEFCVIFVGLFLFQGLKHTFVAILGLGLRSMRPHLIGFVHVTWPYEMVWPLLGVFLSAIGFYTTQNWRIRGEMEHHLKGYSDHWFSKEGWDRYQSYMKCCGIDGWKDWRDHGPIMKLNNILAIVPKSCCVFGEANKNCFQVANASTSSIHSWGCLEITTKSTDIIFVSGTICMLLGIFLGVLGYRSLREAEDCIGDPIHTLLFDTKSSLNGKTGIGSGSRALRRQELFSLLDHYSLLLGHELGLKEDVKKAMEQMGGDHDEVFLDPPNLSASRNIPQEEIKPDKKVEEQSKPEKEKEDDSPKPAGPKPPPPSPPPPPPPPPAPPSNPPPAPEQDDVPRHDADNSPPPVPPQPPTEPWDNSMPEELPDPSRGQSDTDMKANEKDFLSQVNKQKKQNQEQIRVELENNGVDLDANTNHIMHD